MPKLFDVDRNQKIGVRADFPQEQLFPDTKIYKKFTLNTCWVNWSQSSKHKPELNYEAINKSIKKKPKKTPTVLRLYTYCHYK